MSSVTQETWRAIPGWEGKYDASNLGRIRSLPRVANIVRRGLPGTRPVCGGIMTGCMRGNYRAVLLAKDGVKVRRTVHRLIALTWIGPEPNGMQVNHKNGNTTDNSVGNLEYVTPKENMDHAVRLGLMNGVGQYKSGFSITAETAMAIKGIPRSVFATDVAKQFGTTVRIVSNIRTGRTWRNV